MIWARCILAGLLTVTIYASVEAQERYPPPIRQPRDDRYVWVYADAGGGDFTQQRGRDWLETNGVASVPFRYRETNRTADYVELYDAERQLYVRLHNNSMYLKKPGSNWELGYTGRWD